MFNLFRSRRAHRDRDPRIGYIERSALEVAAKLGDLMLEYPSAILDVSRLPLSKSNMKLALKVAWKLAPNADLRRFAEEAYLHLANFQDGVGDIPIEGNMPDNVEPTITFKLLDAWLPWAARAGKEAMALATEFNEFRHQQTGGGGP
jgi:hypothetical protein